MNRTTKRSTKSKRTAPTKTVSPLLLDVFFVFAVILAIFLYLGIRHLAEVEHSNAYFGVLGTTIVKVIGILCGNTAFVVPLFFLAWAIHMLILKKIWSLSMWGMSLFLLTLLAWNSGYRIPLGMNGWEAAKYGMGGGYIGAAVSVCLHVCFGEKGSGIIMALLLMLSLVLIIQKSVTYLLRQAGGRAKVLTKDLSDIILEGTEEPRPTRRRKADFKMPPELPKDIKKEENSTLEASGLVLKAEESKLVFTAEDFIPAENKNDLEQSAAVLAPKKESADDTLQLPAIIPQYIKPSIELLNENDVAASVDKKNIQDQISTLEQTFQNFNLSVKVSQVSCGPSVTRFELIPAPGTKVSKIHGLSDDLQMSLASHSIRIEAPIPGKSAVGIEVPNREVRGVGLKGVLCSPAFVRMQSPLTFVLGEDIAGNSIVAKLSDMPHLLIAGSTGSGKSVCLNAIIMSLLFNARPDEVKFILIDPKMVELTVYNGLPHLMTPVVIDAKRAAQILRWMTVEMEKRYKLFSEAGVRDVYRYREVTQEEMPFIVIIIDELADLMMVAPGDVEDSICRLAQMARAAGIHLIVATQRPSVDVVTGIIKANIPSRVAFAVSSQMDSRTILDMGGAEKLLGKGDMLFLPVGANKPYRIQGAFVSDLEIERTVNFIVEQANQPEYSEELENLNESITSEKSSGDDELFAAAVKIVVESDKASTSILQRKLKLGYSRAARLMDLMEEKGIVSPLDHTNKRKILWTSDQFQTWNNENDGDSDDLA